MKVVPLILALLVTLAIGNSCIGFNKNYLIETGINLFIQVSPSFKTLEAKFVSTAFQKDLITPYLQLGSLLLSVIILTSLATELIEFSSSSSSFYEPIDYSVKGGKNKDKIDQLDILLLISDSSLWRQIRVSYIASSRNDLWIGSFVAGSFNIIQDTFDILNCKDNNDRGYLQTEHYIQNWNDTTYPRKKIGVLVLISGLRTEDQFFQTQLTNYTIDAVSGKILVSVDSNAFPNIELLVLNYVAYELDGLLDFEIYSSPETGPSSFDYKFGGLIRYEAGFNPVWKLTWIVIIVDRLECVGQKCKPGQCFDRQGCLKLSGRVWGRKCFLCGDHQYYENGFCREVCQGNWVYSFSDKKCVCMAGYTLYNNDCQIIPKCQDYEQIVSNVCVCVAGYKKINGFCQKICSTNEVLFNNQCVCKGGFTRKNGVCVEIPVCSLDEELQNNQCVCKPNFIRIGSQCHPVPICKENEVLQNNVCVCIFGYVRLHQRCIEIPRCFQFETLINNTCVCITGYTRVNQRCVEIPKCSQYETLVNNVCVCITGYTRINQRCVQIPKCSPYETLVNNVCVCITGYTRINQRCVQIPQCSAYETLVNNVCICIAGYIRVNQRCVEIPKCSQYETLVNNVCVCIAGYTRINQRCVQIPQCYEYETLVSNVCVCISGYTRINQRCVKIPVCDRSQYWILSGDRCICEIGYTESSGRCIKIPVCLQNEYLVENICGCKPGYFRQGSNCLAVPKCSVYEVLVNNVCVCQPGFYRSGTECFENPKCIDNQELVNNQCVCKKGFTKIGGRCTQIPSCRPGYQIVNNRCVCPAGFVQLVNICVPTCGINERFVNGKCVCVDGHARINFVCRPCPQFSKPNIEQTACVCDEGYEFVGNLCQKKKCPQYSYWKQTSCVCDNGYELVAGKCQKIQCPPRAYWKDICCVCEAGLYLQDNQCKTIPTCPIRSNWNQDRLQCLCIEKEQYIIDGVCKPCGQNQGWNGKICVCLTGFDLVGGKCIACPANTKYNGRDCICNPGWYGNLATGCQRCHDTCSACSGKEAYQCTACVDVSYKLNTNGYCLRNSPCPEGLYLDGKTCKSCSAYCASCQSANSCTTCITGFKRSSLVVSGASVSFCEQICGDGKRFEDECDDGNTVNGDGCSSLCKVQSGWTCSGGTSTRVSTCSKSLYTRSIIQPKSAVLLFGRVVHGIRLTHVPKELTDNNCPQCSSLLWVKVIRSDIVPGVKVNYIPNSKYQFLVEFDFHGAVAIPVFTFTCQLNPRFKDNFSQQDLNQLEIIRVDPALLAKFDEHGSLDLGSLGEEDDLNVPADAQRAALGN